MSEENAPIVVQADLVREWARTLTPYQPHLVEKALRALEARAAVSFVKAIDLLWRSAGEQAGREMEEQFTRDELLHVAALSHAKPEQLAWSASAARQRRRVDALNEVAQSLGYETWTRLETAVINGARLKIDEG